MLFQQAEVHLKWLLDPLPVDARVIVSVTDNTCPQAWRSWPTVNLGCLGTKNVRELLRAEFATLDSWLDAESESRILTHCRTLPTSCPLYIMVMARHIAGWVLWWFCCFCHSSCFFVLFVLVFA